MAQQGSGPGRSSRQPDAEYHSRGDRAERLDRGKRAGRPDRADWEQYDAFSPEADGHLPSWAEPSSYYDRPARTRVRRGDQAERHDRGYRNRDDNRAPDRYGDPYSYRESAEYPVADDYREEVGYQDPYQQPSAHGDRSGYTQPGAYRDLPGYSEPASYGDPSGRRDSGEYRGAVGYADPGTDQELSGYQDRGGYADQNQSGRSAAGYREAGTVDPVGRGGQQIRRRGRAAAARLRKSRRRVYRWCGTAIVLVILAAGGWLLFGQSTPKPSPYVTTLLAGEFKSVPNACTAVGSQVLSQYLPGPGRKTTQENSSSTQSQCGFTIDKKPVFLVLEVSAQAFQPFAAASGNGSATQFAIDNFGLARQGLAKPPHKSPLPPAVISPIPKLGQQAFSAFQPVRVAANETYVATVVIRERNVLITVSLSGQNSGHGFGPVSQATLEAGARAVAASVLAKAMAQPTA